MMKSRRISVQRDKIFDLIAKSCHHPTATWVYETLKKDMPSLSLGNLYRNIKILVEDGSLQSRDFGDGIEHYDAIIVPHYHFVCEICHQISDFPLPIQESITRMAQEQSSHRISGHYVQFFGVCEKCLNKKR